MTNNPQFRDDLDNNPLAALQRMSNRGRSDDQPPQKAPPAPGAQAELIHLDSIVMDRAIQARETIDVKTVEAYAAAMATGTTFPPIDVFFDGNAFYLADGWHRVLAARALLEDADFDKRRNATIAAVVHDGGARDALLFSLGANSEHGLRMTNADKRRVVLVMLTDDEWSQWSDNRIAQQCGVSQPFVSKMRATYNRYKSDRMYVDKYGNVGVMETENIGKADEDEKRAVRIRRSVDRLMALEKVRVPKKLTIQQRTVLREAIQEARRHLDDLEKELIHEV